MGIAAGFSGDFERLILMARKRMGEIMTREELTSLLPEKLTGGEE